MKNLMTAEQLIAFEEDIAQCFNNKMIRAPIHLQSNNFEILIKMFEEINEEDWVCGTWRFHAETLLKGVPPEKAKQDILDGRSIELCNKEHKVFTSAIVAGIFPIALGIALDIKRRGDNNKVYCFAGEMSATCGGFYEAYTYAKNHFLPIVFVISDNGKSVCTDTREVWNTHKLPFEPDEINQGMIEENEFYKSKYLWYYKYRLDYPHAGPGGKRIQF